MPTPDYEKPVPRQQRRIPISKQLRVPKTIKNLDARNILQIGFTAAPLLAGADKFANLMTQWEKYLSPAISRRARVSPRTFMKIVGVVEMAAGIGVAVSPKIFSRVVAAWLGGIIANLMLKRDYYDVALRDLGLLLGALALGQLSDKAALETLH